MNWQSHPCQKLTERFVQSDISRGIDGGTQPRAALNEEHIEDLIQALTDGAKLPPVVVFYDGSAYWLADGFHRYHATKRLYQKHIQAEVRQGTRRDAVLFSVGANAQHGLKRANVDKRRAVETLLRDEEWGRWPETKMAEICKVSRFLVRTVISENPHLVEKQDSVRLVLRNGTVYTQNTANIGRSIPMPVLTGFGRTLVGLEHVLVTSQPAELAPIPVTPQPVYIPPAEPKIDFHQWQEENLALGLDGFGDILESEREQEEEEEEPLEEAGEYFSEPPEPVVALPVVEYVPVFHTPPTELSTPIVEPETEQGEELREIKRQQVKERLAELRANGVALPVGKYSCLVVDPPWHMQKIERDVRPRLMHCISRT